MGTIRGPKRRICRRLGGVAVYGESHSPERRPTPPGQHGIGGMRRRRSGNDYGSKLLEKQKLRYAYNLMEKQFKRYVHEAMRQAGNAEENLVILLERRLDNVVYRLGFTRTIFHARQLVNHGHIKVNGKKVDIPSYQLRPDDVISLRDKSKENVQIVDSLKQRESVPLPTYLEFSTDKKEGKLLRLPSLEEIPVIADTHAIIEFYSR